MYLVRARNAALLPRGRLRHLQPQHRLHRPGRTTPTIPSSRSLKNVGIQVRRRLEQAGFPLERAELRKGFFNESFVAHSVPASIAVLHVDADYYQSVLLTLETFYDRVAEGGVVILDDFGSFTGARKVGVD